MDLCAKISCTLSAVATFFSTLATFTPEWIDFGNQLTEGLIQICVLEVCRNIKGKLILTLGLISLLYESRNQLQTRKLFLTL